MGVPDVGVLAQDAAQVAARLTPAVSEHMVSQLKRSIPLAVLLKLQRDLVVGGPQRFTPEDFRDLQPFVDERANQQSTHYDHRGVIRPRWTQTIETQADRDPEGQRPCAPDKSVPIL